MLVTAQNHILLYSRHHIFFLYLQSHTIVNFLYFYLKILEWKKTNTKNIPTHFVYDDKFSYIKCDIVNIYLLKSIFFTIYF